MTAENEPRNINITDENIVTIVSILSQSGNLLGNGVDILRVAEVIQKLAPFMPKEQTEQVEPEPPLPETKKGKGKKKK